MRVIAVKYLVDPKADGVEVGFVAAREVADELSLSFFMALEMHFKVLLAPEVFVAALMGALVRSVRSMQILMCSAEVLLGKPPIAMRALKCVCSYFVVSKYVIGEIPLVLIDLGADVAGRHLIFWVVGFDVAVELLSLLVGFVATFIFAFERATWIVNEQVCGETRSSSEFGITNVANEETPSVAFIVKVDAVVGLLHCFVAVSALCERHGVVAGYWLFDRDQATKSLKPSFTVEFCCR